jgi:hypothetical protein
MSTLIIIALRQQLAPLQKYYIPANWTSVIRFLYYFNIWIIRKQNSIIIAVGKSCSSSSPNQSRGWWCMFFFLCLYLFLYEWRFPSPSCTWKLLLKLEREIENQTTAGQQLGRTIYTHWWVKSLDHWPKLWPSLFNSNTSCDFVTSAGPIRLIESPK